MIYTSIYGAKLHGCRCAPLVAAGTRFLPASRNTSYKDFDTSCLALVESITPEEIRTIREKEKLSQPVFARYLNVSKNLVSDWERGVKKPGGPALRLLSIVKYKGLDAVRV
jgi:putative transcriptional regulator